MPVFTPGRIFILILFVFSSISMKVAAQCSFTIYPDAHYYCVGTTTIYCIQDTVGANHYANWLVTAAPGDTIGRTTRNMRFNFPINTTGTYVITMSDSVGGQICTSQDTIYVVPNPTAYGTLSETGTYCLPANVCWMDSSNSPNSTFLSYDFDWGAGFVDTSFCHTYDTPGVYYFLVTVTDSLGCYAMYSNQRNITIGGSILSMSASSQTACVCDSVTFTLNSFGAHILTWISGGGTPDTLYNDTIHGGSLATPTITTFTATYCNTGYMHPMVIAWSDTTNCYVIDTLPIPLVIDTALQQPTITMYGNTLIANTTSLTAVTYQWLLEGVPIPLYTDTIIATQNGGYTVAIGNSCGIAVSDSVQVINAGIASISNTTDIQIYPNPATQICYINMSGGSDELYSAMVLDMTGQKIASLFTQRTLYNNPLGFSVVPYDKGIYLLQLTDSHGRIQVQKLVVE